MFPQIRTIDDVLPFIKDRKEFVVLDKGDYIVVDYVHRVSDTFDCPVRRECRGIKFLPDGKLLARPFHKFFNVGEREAGPIDWSRDFSVLEKLDGSMIHPAVVNGQVRLMTRKGITDTAKRAEDLFLSQYENSFLSDANIDVLPMFEWVGPDNLHIVPYNVNRLVHLATRCQYSGVYMIDSGRYPDEAKRFSYWDYGGEDWVKYAKEMEEGEGFVFVFNYDQFYKVKADQYVLRHRVKSDFDKLEAVIELIFEDKVDDLIPMLNQEQQKKLLNFQDFILNCFEIYLLTIDITLLNMKNKSRKDFAIHVNSMNVPAYVRCCFFAALDGKDYQTMLKQQMIKNSDWFKGIWDENC